MSTKIEATIEDLYHVPENGKAEIVDGELRLMSPTGDLPSLAGLEIASLCVPMRGVRERAEPIRTTLLSL
jgi:hypothetical protein